MKIINIYKGEKPFVAKDKCNSSSNIINTSKQKYSLKKTTIIFDHKVPFKYFIRRVSIAPAMIPIINAIRASFVSLFHSHCISKPTNGHSLKCWIINISILMILDSRVAFLISLFNLFFQNNTPGLIPCFYFTIFDIVPLTVVNSACVFICF